MCPYVRTSFRPPPSLVNSSLFSMKTAHPLLTRTHPPDVDVAYLEDVISAFKSAIYVRDAARKNRLDYDSRRLPADNAETETRTVVQQIDRLDLRRGEGGGGGGGGRRRKEEE